MPMDPAMIPLMTRFYSTGQLGMYYLNPPPANPLPWPSRGTVREPFRNRSGTVHDDPYSRDIAYGYMGHGCPMESARSAWMDVPTPIHSPRDRRERYSQPEHTYKMRRKVTSTSSRQSKTTT